MKDEIRTKTMTKIDDETKQSLIKQGKEQAVEEFKNMFGKSYTKAYQKTHRNFTLIYVK
jgi:hypothetical protein